MKLEKLVIDRYRWGKGALLNLDGTMCCLGFVSLACGVPVEKLRNPYGSDSGGVGYPDGDMAEGMSHHFYALAADINDSLVMTVAEKEEQLKKLFGAIGCELTFEGELGVGFGLTDLGSKQYTQF